MNPQALLTQSIQDSARVYGELATARTQYENLKELQKPKLASIMNRVEARSEAERRRRAEGSHEYKGFVSGLCIANQRYRQAQANVAVVEMRFGAGQSMNKRAVAEMSQSNLT